MSALVNDTRAIGAPMSTSAERPTSKSTAFGSVLSITGADPDGSAAGVWALEPNRGLGCTCAKVAWVPNTPMMNMWTPHAAIRAVCRVIRISLLLGHNFLCPFVTTDDLDGRNGRGLHVHSRGAAIARHSSHRRRGCRAHQRSGTNARRRRRRLIQGIAQRQLNLSFGAGERQPLGFFRVHEHRDHVDRDRFVVFG